MQTNHIALMIRLSNAIHARNPYSGYLRTVLVTRRGAYVLVDTGERAIMVGAVGCDNLRNAREIA